MGKMVKKISGTHRKASGTWTHGEPEHCWTDKDGCFCIRYEDGSWWHYKETDGILEWW